MEVSEANCHPFEHGRYLFMHNGSVGSFDEIRRPLLEGLSDEAFDLVRGTTDTEHLFAVFVDELARAGWMEPPPPRPGRPSALATCLNRAVFRVLALARGRGGGAPSFVNVAVSDGDRSAVCRFTDAVTQPPESLYYIEDGLYPPAAGDSPGRRRYEGARSVVVASERLTDAPAWREVPPNHVLDLTHDGPVALWRMDPDGLVAAEAEAA